MGSLTQPFHLETAQTLKLQTSMACLAFTNTIPNSVLSFFPHHTQNPRPPSLSKFYSPSTPTSPSVSSSGELGGRRRTRGFSVITRAGPSTTSYIFAFVFPFSLLAITIFTSARIADKLDQKFLEEMAVNQVILEAEEEDGDVGSSIDQEPERRRNRPKREAEPSSM